MVCISYKSVVTLDFFFFLNADWSIIVIFIVVVIIIIFTLHAVEGINLAVGLASGLSSVLLRTK